MLKSAKRGVVDELRRAMVLDTYAQPLCVELAGRPRCGDGKGEDRVAGPGVLNITRGVGAEQVQSVNFHPKP